MSVGVSPAPVGSTSGASDAILPASVPSSLRLQVMLTLFAMLLVVGLSALMFVVVARIFDRLTPAMRTDLQWKTQRGAIELANGAEVGLALGDADLVHKVFAPYERSDDVLGLVGVDSRGNAVAAFGTTPEGIEAAFAGPPGEVRALDGYYVSWSPSTIEGSIVGKIAVLVSTAKLVEGVQMRKNILLIGGVACLGALALSIVFVRFYIGPILALTMNALGKLRELTSTLEERVRRRTAELTGSKQELEKMVEQVTATRQKLMTASRVAGMAEVATSVLHNVGNVLNSVNVSMSLVADRLRQSKIAGLTKVVQLIRVHDGDLGSFLTTDPRGRKLPEYLALLATSLEDERGEMLAELESLETNVNHIKVIVNMQQTHAKTSVGVMEIVKISDLMEEAVRFNLTSYEKHDIHIERDYDDLEAMNIDRHKLFQVLMNLLSNARHAVKDVDRAKTIRVAIRARGDGLVAIEVHDNGVGIAPENMNKLYVYGFTTKKTGHGFGLHSSALAAKELGGSLRCVSDGPDQGATFILELPAQAAHDTAA